MIYFNNCDKILMRKDVYLNERKNGINYKRNRKS